MALPLRLGLFGILLAAAGCLRIVSGPEISGHPNGAGTTGSPGATGTSGGRSSAGTGTSTGTATGASPTTTGTTGGVTTTGNGSSTSGGTTRGSSTGSTTAGTCQTGPASDLQSVVSGAPSTYFFDLVTGDLNGDGLLDLISSSFVDGGFDVSFGEPDGGLSDPTSYTGSAGQGTAVGDLNGDGWPDVVVSDGVTVYVFLNDGTGTLTAGASFLIAPNGPFDGALNIAIGDLNADGFADLLIVGDVAASLANGNGKGEFETPVPLQGFYPATWGGLIVADLNLDGLPDIVTNSEQGVGVFLNQGDGGFSKSSYAQPANAIALVPNPSGAPDLVANTPDLQYLRNRGDGTFAVQQLGKGGYWLAVGDFNGDCIPDIVTTFSPGCGGGSTLTVLYGDGDGGFGTPEDLPLSGPGPAHPALLGPVASPRALAVGDWCQPGLAIYGKASQP